MVKKTMVWKKLLVLFFTMRTIEIIAISQPVTKIYRHFEDGTPSTIDPVEIRDNYSNRLVTSCYDTLFEYKYLKRPYELKANLAETFPEISKDGLIYTIKIKKGVYFKDDAAFKTKKGREVTAHDFVYSIKRHFHKDVISTGKWLWQNKILGLDDWGRKSSDFNETVPGILALDKHTVKITLKKKYPQFLYTLALGYSAVVPREAVEKYKKGFSFHPVGSGPWYVSKFNLSKAILNKNPNYRNEFFDINLHGYKDSEHKKYFLDTLKDKKLPRVDTVEIYFINNPSVRWNSFAKANEIQYNWLPSEQQKKVLMQTSPVELQVKYKKKFHFKTSSDFGIVYMEFNMKDKQIGYHPDPVQNQRNKALRCAIRKGFNWTERINRMYDGIGHAIPGVIPKDVEGFDPNLSSDSVSLDIEGAKKLMSDNNWNSENLPTLTYSGVSSVKFNQFYIQFRSWMTKIGFPKFKVILKTFPNYSAFSKAVKSGQLMTHSLAWSLDYPDAENILQLYYSKNHSPGVNSSFYNNKQFDAIFERATAMQPSKDRTKLYRQANQILIEDCVVIAGFSRTRVHLWYKNVVLYPDQGAIGNLFKYVDII